MDGLRIKAQPVRGAHYAHFVLGLYRVVACRIKKKSSLRKSEDIKSLANLEQVVWDTSIVSMILSVNEKKALLQRQRELEEYEEELVRQFAAQ